METTKDKISRYKSGKLSIDDENDIALNDINHMADEEKVKFESCQQAFDYDRNIPGGRVLGDQLENDLMR